MPDDRKTAIGTAGGQSGGTDQRSADATKTTANASTGEDRKTAGEPEGRAEAQTDRRVRLQRPLRGGGNREGERLSTGTAVPPGDADQDDPPLAGRNAGRAAHPAEGRQAHAGGRRRTLPEAGREPVGLGQRPPAQRHAVGRAIRPPADAPTRTSPERAERADARVAGALQRFHLQAPAQRAHPPREGTVRTRRRAGVERPRDLPVEPSQGAVARARAHHGRAARTRTGQGDDGPASDAALHRNAAGTARQAEGPTTSGSTTTSPT